jgi:hypothetical protein
MVKATTTLPREEISQYCEEIFYREPREPEYATEIVRAMLVADTPRVSDIARHMEGTFRGGEKMVERFLQFSDPKESLQMLFDDDAEFVIGDVVEVPRPQAKHTAYVGKLKDGETHGYNLLMLGTPYRGRTLPFHFVSYSSATLGEAAGSRNGEHMRVIEEAEWPIDDRPIVLDREFSYRRLVEYLNARGLSFVIRLNTANAPRITAEADERAAAVSLQLSPGESRKLRNVWYQGAERIHLAGVHEHGRREPLWVMSNVEEPERALELYRERMKVEQQFRHLKTLLHMDKLMNKRQDYMEKLIAMLCIAYTIGLVIGEHLRDWLHRQSGKKMGPLLWAICAPQATATHSQKRTPRSPRPRSALLP